MNTDSSPNANSINKILNNLIKDIIQQLHLEPSRGQQLQKALSCLGDISNIYKMTEEELYEETVCKVETVSLLKFEVSELLEKLIEKYFKRVPLFKEAYEIAELKSIDNKYKRLLVDEPVLTMKIPTPFICPPLVQAQHLGQARCLTFEQEQDKTERFS